MALFGAGTTGTEISFGDLSTVANRSSITVAGWFRFADLAVRQDIITQWGWSGTRNFNLLVGVTARRAQFYISNDGSVGLTSGADTTDLLTNVWYHLAGVYDGSTAYLYRDGVLVNSASVGTFSTFDSTASVKIGNNSETTERNINGSVAEVGIWADALTSAELFRLASGERNRVIRRESLVLNAALTGLTGNELERIDQAIATPANMFRVDHPPDLRAVSRVMSRVKIPAAPPITRRKQLLSAF